MAIRKILVATASIGLMASPVIAAGPAQAVQAAGLEVAPTSETVEGNQIAGTSTWLIAGLAIAAIVIAIILIAGGDDNDKPASP